MNYFECNLKENAPSWLEPSLQEKFQQVSHNVIMRMAKLQKSLEITGLNGETFAKYAKVLFDMNASHFDALTAEALSQLVMQMWDGECLPSLRIDFPNAVVLYDTAFATVEEWELLRHIGAGGSDADAICGTQHFKTKRETYYAKTGVRQETIDDGARIRFARGHAVEDRVIDIFCQNTGATRTHETRMFQSRRCPYVTANPDEIIITVSGDICLFEAKSTAMENADAWKDNKSPVAYQYQTLQYTAVLDDPRIKMAYLGCLFVHDMSVVGKFVEAEYDAKKFVSRIIMRDIDLELRIIAKEEEFFTSHIIPRVEPPLSGRVDADTEMLVRRYPGQPDPNAPVVDLSPEEYLEDIEEYERISVDIKGLQERMDSIKLRIMDALGDSTLARLPVTEDEVFQVKYMPQKRRGGIDTEKLEAFFPDAYEMCKKPDISTRPFRISRKRIRMHRT